MTVLLFAAAAVAEAAAILEVADEVVAILEVADVVVAAADDLAIGFVACWLEVEVVALGTKAASMIVYCPAS